jgi:hypothetical protein
MSLADSFNIIGDRATSGRLFVIAKLDGKRIESVVYVNTQNGSMKGEKLIITADNQCMVYTDK